MTGLRVEREGAVVTLTLLDGQVTPLEAHLDAEVRSIAGQARKPEGREGIAAFLAKRKPDFLGSAHSSDRSGAN